MSTRFRVSAIIVLALLVTLGAVLTATVEAQTLQKEPTLRERLVTGLQVRRPSEFAYIDAVIDTIERGELPQKLVDKYFFWAREKPARSVATQRPIIYFEQGLTRAAIKMKIKIAPTPPPTTL